MVPTPDFCNTDHAGTCMWCLFIIVLRERDTVFTRKGTSIRATHVTT